MPDVHWHLRRKVWSLRERGRVVGQVATLALADVSFRVSAAGVRRVQARRAREVVAFVRGVPVESNTPPPGAVRVCFCPYRGAEFTLEDGTPVSAAAFVHLAADGSCWAVNPR
ncbi:hypothetical protein [Methylobacterium gnaphalii]|uniref:Uncharacterized protein n=1 Tax=Methylobacterium gnaphalii TaxID=1010610 RepID=A0A512JG22_9HYPH|nr:hypothetical protein [Methylobacterium gnaphalii]GEP08899.1 hypothetical protein MGN01_07440 [Methylobacterium gnaphalii]GJD70665.1 hypothetical protein MMMDOFMJ_3617 [Methylobacterium gnaphalii]GLS50455.1 hypothetical protein GCM10007885_33070 [Methylobacterium gnaphalii]